MRSVLGNTYTANFTISEGSYVSIVLIFSSDFTGTVQGVAFAGAADYSLQLGANGELLKSVNVVVTAGSVRLVGA